MAFTHWWGIKNRRLDYSSSLLVCFVRNYAEMGLQSQNGFDEEHDDGHGDGQDADDVNDKA